jgi:serine phosphatase RsbU (regulator of sigma subunit)
MGRHLRLRAAIAAVVAAGAIVVALGVALLLSNTVNLRRTADAAIRSDAYLAAVSNVERLVVDAETGLRGYVITGRPLFLAPLRAAQAGLPHALATLDQAATGEHAFEAQARGLAAAAQAYLAAYVPALLAAGAHNPKVIRTFRVTLLGKQLVDRVRGSTAALENLVSARLNTSERVARDAAHRSEQEAIVVLVLLTVMTVLLGAVLGRLAVGREVARARSELTSRSLQESILPRAIPPIPGCELAVRFAPAGPGELVGGDFYDVFAVGKSHWAIVLGDVCGKGAHAAAVTAMARWTLHSLSAEAVAPAEALRFLNQAMLREDLEGRFITIAYLLLSVDAGHAHVSVACAGHPAPVVVPAAGDPAPLKTQGTLLGVWDELNLETVEVELTRGDSVVSYTDGVTDQGPSVQPPSLGEMFGHSPAGGSSAEQLASRLERYAQQLRGRQRDDIAILALRFTGAGPGGGRPAADPSGHVLLAG